jgi:hypothetical protein
LLCREGIAIPPIINSLDDASTALPPQKDCIT